MFGFAQYDYFWFNYILLELQGHQYFISFLFLMMIVQFYEHGHKIGVLFCYTHTFFL
jgi:hypothetical protein